MAALEMVAEVTAMYKEERFDVDNGFEKMSLRSVQMEEIVGADVSIPCIAHRQQHRSNPQACTSENYYKTIAIHVPLLDHILSSMEAQFSEAATVASSLLGIVPSVCCSHEVQLHVDHMRFS